MRNNPPAAAPAALDNLPSSLPSMVTLVVEMEGFVELEEGSDDSDVGDSDDVGFEVVVGEGDEVVVDAFEEVDEEVVDKVEEVEDEVEEEVEEFEGEVVVDSVEDVEELTGGL